MGSLAGYRARVLNHNGYAHEVYEPPGSSLQAAPQRAELHAIRLHDLRHTCATILLMAGKHYKYLQDFLGHASMSITPDTCSHGIEGMDGGLADIMDDVL